MEFTVEFYETVNGRVPVQEFLDELKASDPGDFASVLAGLAKLRNRSITASRCPRPSMMACLSSATSAS